MRPLHLLFVVAVGAGAVACSPSPAPEGSSRRGAAPDPASAASTYDPALARQLTVEAIGACRAEDFDSCRESLISAASHRPGQVEIWMLLAGVEHRLGNQAAAEEALGRIVQLGQSPPFERAPFYDTLIDTELQAETVERLVTAGAARSVATPLLTLEEVDLVPEGVAYDPLTGTFYVSSVHRRGIVSWHDGTSRRLVPDDTLWAVLGIAVDAERRILWATTAALAQMRGYTEDLVGRSALVAIDLESGAEQRRFELGTDRPHVLNDLAIATDGTVYVADNRPPGGVYRLSPGAEGLAAVAPEAHLRSPQGLALSADGERLYVADYSFGMAAIDLGASAPTVVYLQPPEHFGLTGIDGLAAVPGEPAGPDVLIAIQNLYPPHRVLRLVVDAAGRRITEVTVLEQARPDYSEPTLGTVADGAFVYIANSQWNRFDAEARLPAPDQLARPLILSLPL